MEADVPADTCDSCPPASDEPRPSTIMIHGKCSRNSRLRCADSAAPPDKMVKSEDRSRVLFFSPSKRGRANASPTIKRKFAFSFSTNPQMSSGSSRSGCDCTMIVPPLSHVRIAIQCPAPCINGGLGSDRSPPTASCKNSSTVVAVFEPPKHSTTASAFRQSTPFGIPVVPPVYKM